MAGEGQLYFGGEVYTVDEALPAARAVAVRDGRIIEVGSEAGCRAALGKDFEAVDLKGRALLPGFIDTHLHPVLMIYFDMNLDLRGTRSMKELERKMREAVRKGKKDDWVVGLQFDEEALDEPRLLDRRDLDDLCPDRPAIIIKHDGHMVMANTRAIEAAGISASTPDPEGGRIDREQDGRPAGVFRESASQVILGAMPMPDIPAFLGGAAGTFSRLAACGITSAGIVLQTGEEGPAGSSGRFDVLAMQMLVEKVPISLYGLLIADSAGKVEEARKTGLHGSEVGGHRIGGLKIFADGTFGSCTAYMNEPFTDQPSSTGFMVRDPGDIYRLMVEAHEAGLQVCVHAIGDLANRTVVDLYDRLLTEHPRPDHRHRLEHASIVDDGIISDIARLGLVISSQPLFIHSEKHWLKKRLGPKRAKMTYPFRSFLDAGIKLAGASDAPIESSDVLHAIQVCVTRDGFEPHQAISAAQAVRMFTLDAAYAQFEDKVKGSISPGKRADMVVLSRNPLSVPAEEIRSIRVEETICGGNIIYNGG